MATDMKRENMERIPVAGPWITEKEVRYAADAAANAWYANANTYITKFEKSFAEYIGVPHAVSLPSCTSALHLALAALGVGPGDEVIVPDLTWIASAAPVSYVGARPVFADVDPTSWCIDTASAERLVTSRTRAIIAVDLYGNMPDMERLSDLAKRRGLAFIEDAAEAIGSRYAGRRSGSFGDVATFSFHGSKTLTTGEGGMLLTSRKDVFERVMKLRDHGRNPGDRMFMNHEVAYKYKMSALQAALGLAQLERVEELLQRKREMFAWYSELLGGTPGLTLNRQHAGVDSVYWMVTAIIDPRLGVSKEALMAGLDAAGIDSRPVFHPLSALPAYAAHGGADDWRKRNPVTYSLAPWGVNLPSALILDRTKVERVAEVVRARLRTESNYQCG